jgi:ABC-type polysaccharide/polyol phosphate export permease
MGIFVAALSLINGTLFHQDMLQSLPYIATGIIFWGLITSCINEGTTVFISREGYIRNVPMPISVHLYQMIARNIIIWLFNMVIYVAVLLILRLNPGWNIFLFLLSGPLLIVNITWMSLVAGIFSTRFRDIPQVIASVIQIVFFLTPVFWSVETLPRRPAFVTANPLYHLLEVVREPLLGRAPTALSWSVSVALAVFGCVAAAWLYRRSQPRIAYWV